MLQTNSPCKPKRGFTLIELLVVISILAILMGIVVGVAGSVQRKAAISQARAQIQGLMSEIELYKTDVGQYPLSKRENNRDVMVTRKNASNQNDPPGFMDWYEDKYPNTRFEIISVSVGANNEVLFLDPWGRPVVYKYDNNNPFVYLIGSTGPDQDNGLSGNRTFGDGDDITSRNGQL